MIRDFIAIDFETANQQPSSVCSIGVVMVRNGQVADSFYSLIQPEPNYYNYWCQRVHGLSQCDTDDIREEVKKVKDGRHLLFFWTVIYVNRFRKQNV